MTTMHTYTVYLQKNKPGPGYGSLTVKVQAPTSRMARQAAESQWNGYRATGDGFRVSGT
jgi:hypothetical protein